VSERGTLSFASLVVICSFGCIWWVILRFRILHYCLVAASAFLPDESDVVHFSTTAAGGNEKFGFSNGRTAQIAPFDLWPTTLYVTVSTPAHDTLDNADWLNGLSYKLVFSLSE
jgi:hypothetical protein